ncbi:Transposon Ty3-I Gag-Pol polyprotein [Vitis vinifera]|uniref:Transposon Ty3-I Gag-Pol polyprotein n=1 Tax=Vitis vinifera TaxID=29760 RepID=A0A438CHY5_VITVI|nr:Transposon Ty3-I Gag-Pol polyprotein [Vitis vinifera]
MVDFTVGHGMLSFLDAFFGYYQIPMYQPDEENIAFITPHGLYYYKVMSFGLKNARATYQRLMTKIFKTLIRRTIEVYIDDIVVKSKTRGEHDQHLEEVSHLMREYNMKLNPSKCTFGGVYTTGWTKDCQLAQGAKACLLHQQSNGQCGNPILKNGANNLGLENAAQKLYPYFQAYQVIRLGFPASNNEAEYEAILSRLNLAIAFSASKPEICSNSQLIVGHIQGEYEAKDERITQYLSKVHNTLNRLSKWSIKRIPRIENVQADTLARVVATLPIKEAISLPIHLQTISSIAITPMCNANEAGAGRAHEI